MRDARRGSGRKGASRASRRSDPYARDTRPRPSAATPRDTHEAAPAPTTAPQAGMSYPPPELSIRGSSGPTWIIVSNLVVGTSTEDVRLTFSSFGRVEEVKQRPAPSANHPTVSFEVAFDQRQDAETAVEKFHGALADGRILQVSIKKPEVARDAVAQFQRATAQAVAQRPREKAPNHIAAPAPLPYTPAPAAAVAAAIPTAPASMRSRAKAAELLEPRAKKSNQPTTPAAGTKTPVPAKKPEVKARPLAERIPEPLANRLLTPAQAQKLRAEEAKKKARDEAKARAIAATGKNTVLGKRLGGLPLAQRLVQQAGTPKSDQTAIRAAADKKKRKKEAARARKTGKNQSTGMELD
ncbi:uncharacterized protein PAN0_012d4496 [Moesziomyces antarcticus]|uniref:Uncharacterized protein n=2 Tax=Pseudozyma antarctica TaxID=84753 RepID=A0A081CHX8_PSEA2|nr:uncharacterized protein PAN0_012d4496 [Moesziomyces antarcticus]GAK66274.1 conserved hypothetical protein [Moesziomyces antarcticus]SPO48532.1 uncharacterized protein PSANT_06223 [Moesziomyces antarcticus]